MLFKISSPILPLLAVSLVSTGGVSAQDFSAAHNLSAISGTWSSGSKQVITGSGFANPADGAFTYPKTTGVSYSFTDDGYYEVARYRINGNGTEPTCIVGVINWCHGKFDFNSNGSLTLTPFGDGYQQIQDPCAAVSNFVEEFNYTELYTSWRIFQDPTDGFKLHLFGFDGTPVAPLFQLSPGGSESMLPTRALRNVTSAASTTDTAAGVQTTTKDGLTTQVQSKRSNGGGWADVFSRFIKSDAEGSTW